MKQYFCPIKHGDHMWYNIFLIVHGYVKFFNDLIKIWFALSCIKSITRWCSQMWSQEHFSKKFQQNNKTTKSMKQQKSWEGL